MATATMLMLKNTRDAADYYGSPDKILALVTKRLDNGEYHAVGTVEVGSLTGEDAAEELFDLTNNPGRQDEREEKYGRGRSLSVGDVVRVDGEEFVCASFGWKRIGA